MKKIFTPEGNMTYFVSPVSERVEQLRVNWKGIKINISPNEQIMRKCQVLFSGFYLTHKKAKDAVFYSFDTQTNTYFITCCNNTYELSDGPQPQGPNRLELHKRPEDDTKSETVAPL